MTGRPLDSSFIVERSRQFLQAHHGRVREEALLAHVFGVRGRADVWRSLLRSALQRADQIIWRDDGTWELLAPAPAGLGDYCVVDVETTGLNPRRQRIIEIAIHRYRGGRCDNRWSTSVNPERRVPAYIRQLTGLGHDGLIEAPTFAQVADDVLAELGDDWLVGQNVAFDLAFLNAELGRLGRPPLTNPTLDLALLAVALIPSLRRPNLEAIAGALGVMAPRRHRADVDAAITASCFERLVARAAATGHETWEQLTALTTIGSAEAAAAPPPDETPPPLQRGRDLLDTAWLDAIPARPGVYLMRDAAGQVIYVGKAKNLHSRVRSYYSQPIGLTRKMDGLLTMVRQIDTEVVGSELEALLLESRLIKRYLPRYNVQQRYFEHYPFIRIDRQNPYPRVTATRAVSDDGARYFGPFRNSNAVQTTIELLTDLFPVRTCTQKVTRPEQRWRSCLRLDLGQCLGPCVGRTDPTTYQALVDDIISYLDGQREPLVQRLWQQLRLASERLDYERAARLRDAIGHVGQVTIAHQLLTSAVEQTHCLIVLPSAEPAAREVLLILRGRLIGQHRLPHGQPAAALAMGLHRAWREAVHAGRADQPVGQAMIDEIAIISRWLHQHADSPAICALPDDLESIAGWQSIGAHLYTLTLPTAPVRRPRPAPIDIDSVDRFHRDE